jgi:hypothetical protein
VAGPSIIEAWAMKNGIELMTWYLNEALRIREFYVIPQAMKDAKELLEWMHKHKERIER